MSDNVLDVAPVSDNQATSAQEQEQEQELLQVMLLRHEPMIMDDAVKELFNDLYVQRVMVYGRVWFQCVHTGCTLAVFATLEVAAKHVLTMHFNSCVWCVSLLFRNLCSLHDGAESSGTGYKNRGDLVCHCRVRNGEVNNVCGIW